MGLFSFGGSKSSSQSSGFSRAQDQSISDSISGGSSVSGGQSTSGQNIAFEDIFAKLFGGASDAAGRLDPSMLTQQANTLFSGGMNFFDSLGGGADSEYLAGRVSGESPVLQEQIDALGGDIGRFFSEQINPAITSEAIAGGALGGGRQGVAQGAAAAAAGREFQTGATKLRSDDIAARDTAAGTLGNQRIASAGTAFSGIPALGGAAEQAFSAELAPYAALSQILGGPTTLTNAQSSQFATAEDFARAFSESFGSSYSTQQSTGKSKAFSLGF
ncbi:MAG: hypothetical protein WD795_16345 [Woeseia sp.]